MDQKCLLSGDENLMTPPLHRPRSHSVLTQVVPDVHFSAQRSDFNDALAQEIIRFPLQSLLHPRLDVVILIPHTHFDSV